MTSAYDYDCDGCLRTLAQVPLEAAIAPSTCLHHLTSGFYRVLFLFRFEIFLSLRLGEGEERKEEEKGKSGLRLRGSTAKEAKDR